MKFYAIEVSKPNDKVGKRYWYQIHYRGMDRSQHYELDNINWDCLEKDIDVVNRHFNFMNKFHMKPKLCEFELLRINDHEV